MRTRRALYPQTSEMYICELDQCPLCGEQLELSRYSSGHKIVQNLSSTVEVGYWPKQCDNQSCINYKRKWRSAEWQQIAPMHCTYGFDVITTIGWQRQTSRCTFEDIHSDLAGRIIISESQVRHLYQERYLPLLASQERTRWDESGRRWLTPPPPYRTARTGQVYRSSISNRTVVRESSVF